MDWFEMGKSFWMSRQRLDLGQNPGSYRLPEVGLVIDITAAKMIKMQLFCQVSIVILGPDTN